MDKVEKYHVAEFSDYEKCSAFRKELMSYRLTPAGTLGLGTEPRPVVWVTGSSLTTMYLSPGAVRTAQQLGLDVPITREIQPTQLPENKSLLMGVPLDWENTESEA